MKLLRHLLRSPGFVVGALLLLATLLLAFLPPLLLELDTSRRVGLAYVPPTAGRWLGTDHLGLDMFALLVSGLRSSLYVGFLAGIVAGIRLFLFAPDDRSHGKSANQQDNERPDP
jgi:peptide/nickel transport system permease protein